MMLYQRGATIKPDGLAVRMHDNGAFAMIRLTDRDELFVNTTDQADALITAACEAKRLLLARRKPADWCTAYTGPDDELDHAVYCDRQAGHPGNHHGAPGDGSEVAWPNAELVALKQEMDPPAVTDERYRLTAKGLAELATLTDDDDESGEDATVAIAESSETEALYDAILAGTPVIVTEDEPDPPRYVPPGTGERCRAQQADGGGMCTAQPGHDGPDHVIYGTGGRELARFLVTSLTAAGR